MISMIMAILKMEAILNLKIYDNFMTIYHNRGVFCAIFYFFVFLVAILEAIMDFFKRLKSASLAPINFVKSSVKIYQNCNKPLWDLHYKVTCHFLQTTV